MGMERYKRGDLPRGADVPRLWVQLKTLEGLCGLLIDAKVTELVSVRRGIFEQGAESQEPTAVDSGRWGRRVSGRGAPAPEAPPVGLIRTEVVDSGGLFSIEHFTIELKCFEGSVWDILNALAKSQLFTVMTSITIVNDNPVPKIAAKLSAPSAVGIFPTPGSLVVMPGAPAPAAAAAAEQKSEVKTQEQRVIAGREAVNVVLDIDVYRFHGGEKQEAKQ
jgi:hypothetical protein